MQKSCNALDAAIRNVVSPLKLLRHRGFKVFNILVHKDARNLAPEFIERALQDIRSQCTLPSGYRRGQLFENDNTYEFLYLWNEGESHVFFVTQDKDLVEQVTTVAHKPSFLINIAKQFTN